MRDEHVRACISIFIYVNESFTLPWGFASHLQICLQQEVPLLCSLSWTGHVRCCWFTSRPTEATLRYHLESAAGAVSSICSLPLSLIQAVDHSGKSMRFGKVMRSICSGRDGHRRKERGTEGGRSNSMSLSPFSLSSHHSFPPAPTARTHLYTSTLSPPVNTALIIFMYVTLNVSAWLYLWSHGKCFHGEILY